MKNIGLRRRISGLPPAVRGRLGALAVVSYIYLFFPPRLCLLLPVVRYFIFTDNVYELNVMLADLDEAPSIAATPAVAHAVMVLHAQRSGNYRKFFQLYRVSKAGKKNSKRNEKG